MSMKAYLQHTWPELLLTAAMAVCMGLQAAQCFHIAPELALNVPLVAAVCCAVVLWLHLSVFSLRSLAIGIPLFMLACAIGAFAASGGNLGALVADDYSNPALIYPVLIITALAVFCLTRKKTTTALLAIGGCIFCGAVEFLYVQGLAVSIFVFMCASVALLACKNTLFEGVGEATLRFEGSKLLSALAVCAVAALLCCGAFFLVVAPLNPPVHELKLVTKYYALEEVHVSGYTELLHQRNEELSSKNTSEDEDPTDKTQNDAEQHQGDTQTAGQDDSGDLGAGGIIPDNLGDPMNLVRYFQEHWWLALVVPCVVVAVWTCVVLVRRRLRLKRFERWNSLPSTQQVVAEYLYLRGALERICKVSSAGMTPAEYAHAAEGETASLERVGDTASFGQLSGIAAAAAYGRYEPSAQELAQMKEYASLLPKRLLNRFGRMRYMRIFFRV